MRYRLARFLLQIARTIHPDVIVLVWPLNTAGIVYIDEWSATTPAQFNSLVDLYNEMRSGPMGGSPIDTSSR
jgi:hypothetical protein